MIVVALLIGGVVLAATSAAESTTSRPAATPVPTVAAATALPAAFAEAWRAPDSSFSGPVVAGGAVITGAATADPAAGGTVTARDPATGAERWSYHRDRDLCDIGAGFPAADPGTGLVARRVLALYAGPSGWCSELTMLDADTGRREGAANPDSRTDAQLSADGGAVLLADPQYLQTVRSDLVRTLEYGAAPAPAQPDRQPRPQCAHLDAVLAAERIAVLERCPGEPTDRLTLLDLAGTEDDEQPQELFSTLLPGRGGAVVAVEAERVAVAVPGPSRLLVFDRAGVVTGQAPLSVPDTEIGAGPADRGAAELVDDGSRRYWWSGTRTVALDAGTLQPQWTVEGTLGPPVIYGGALLVPVPGGLAELDPATGTSGRLFPVSRDDPTASVHLAAAGDTVLEHRGADVVALRPSGT